MRLKLRRICINTSLSLTRVSSARSAPKSSPENMMQGIIVNLPTLELLSTVVSFVVFSWRAIMSTDLTSRQTTDITHRAAVWRTIARIFHFLILTFNSIITYYPRLLFQMLSAQETCTDLYILRGLDSSAPSAWKRFLEELTLKITVRLFIFLVHSSIIVNFVVKISRAIILINYTSRGDTRCNMSTWYHPTLLVK